MIIAAKTIKKDKIVNAGKNRNSQCWVTYTTILAMKINTPANTP
jgi:hypothetical protein